MTVEEWLGKDNKIGLDIWHKKYQNNNESFEDWLTRVSNGEEHIKDLIKRKCFLFGGRILANRGLAKDGRKITYSNCYVIAPPSDNIESIFECASKLARTYSYGGGCGIDIGKLAPRGAHINNAAKETSGAVSFMDLYSMVTGLIGQGGRRGALMISIPCDHPDIEEFIGVKSDLSRVTKANISIRITDQFMKAVESNGDFELKFMREETGEVIKKIVNARELFHKIAEMNWRTGEPGMLFWDTIGNQNLQSLNDEFQYAGVNPCAEEPLPEGGSCLLGSLNLAEFVKNEFEDNAEFDFDYFSYAVRWGVYGLNSVLDEGLPLHPLTEQRQSVSDWRQIGLGVFGIADMLIKLGYTYGSENSFAICDKIGQILAEQAIYASQTLAESKGTYSKWSDSVYVTPFFSRHKAKEYPLRNSQLLTIAPTGTLSTMLGVSGGIEPIFANSYTRKTESLHNKDAYYKVYTPIVERYMKIHNIASESELPESFITAPEIDYNDRIRMQSIWQSHIDASISSTINLPNDATTEEIEEIYYSAWSNNLKGITVFRDGCERAAILSADKEEKAEKIHSSDLPRGMIEDVPTGLTYRKYKIKSGCGSLYLFVGLDENEGKIYDFFTNTDGVGGCTVSTQANSRLMSACIRGGVPIKYVIEQLQKAGTCPSFQYARGKGQQLSKGRSCPSAIAYILQDIMDEIKRDDDDDEDSNKSVSLSADGGTCPECGAREVVHEGGCLTCKNCGWSKCS